MPRAVYSRQIALAHALSHLLITVPPGTTWVIRTISIFYPGAITDSSLQVVELTSSATVYKDDQGIISGSASVIENDLRLTFEAGQEVELLGAGDPDVGLFGYVFVDA